jgi:hypothetical protein
MSLAPSSPPELYRCAVAVGPRALRRQAWLAVGVLALTTTGCVSTSTASPTPTGPVSVLSCQDVIASEAAPPTGSSVILDRVALPTGRALQASPAGVTDPSEKLFAKDGLLIRRGAAFDLVVPEAWRGRLGVSWGSMAKPTSQLRVPGCRPTQRMPSSSRWVLSDEWLVYPGGYSVPQPACVSLVVRAGQTERTVQIGVGAACPGQSPPASPA